MVSYNASGKLDSFSVDFDNGDFDEFIGEALGVISLRTKRMHWKQCVATICPAAKILFIVKKWQNWGFLVIAYFV